MARPVTLFTGQWADLPLEKLAKKAKSWGYDGLELACWGDHFDVDKALSNRNYCNAKRAMLKKYGLKVFAISTHLVGQAVCDNIDERHQAILPPDVWGDGDPEGVRKRAAQKVIDAAKAAKKLGVKVVNGFTGSSIWHMLYSFPPASPDAIDAGYKDFAKRWLEPVIGSRTWSWSPWHPLGASSPRTRRKWEWPWWSWAEAQRIWRSITTAASATWRSSPWVGSRSPATS